MCWDKKIPFATLLLSWDQCLSGLRVLFSINLSCLTLATHWEPLCEGSSGSRALFFMEQIDGHSCRLKVIPVERQRTLSQPRTSWNWNLAVWAHLCCALFDQDIKLICLISHPGGAEHCDSKGLLQLTPVSVVMWQWTLPVSPKSRGCTWAKLRKKQRYS